MPQLRGRADPDGAEALTQKLWGGVETVWPDHGAELFIDANLAKVPGIIEV